MIRPRFAPDNNWYNCFEVTVVQIISYSFTLLVSLNIVRHLNEHSSLDVRGIRIDYNIYGSTFKWLMWSSAIYIEFNFVKYIQSNGRAQDCGNSSALAMELLQSCNKLSIRYLLFSVVTIMWVKKWAEVKKIRGIYRYVYCKIWNCDAFMCENNSRYCVCVKTCKSTYIA